MPTTTSWPLDIAHLIRNSRKLIRQLRSASPQRSLKIAILGGSTSQELAQYLELMLLERGFNPTFWHSEFGRYWEDGALGNEALQAFAPDLVYIHTGSHNIRNWPERVASEGDAKCLAQLELDRFAAIWDGLHARCSVMIVQNNFELPDVRILGNLDAVHPSGKVNFTDRLNTMLAAEVNSRPYMALNDVRYLAARMGLDHWYDPQRWFSYKIPITPAASITLAFNLASLISARYGLSKKALILDLDNTVWGGEIGEDGSDAIVIGRETARAEAFTHFQEYVRDLAHRGIVIAAASKNDDAVARGGFAHPDSVLLIDDFSSFKANWEPKHENIQSISQELSLGLDSFVFVDDNPFERSLVSSQLPTVTVPDINEDPATFARTLDRNQYFESLSLSPEDLTRSAQYAGNMKRNEFQGRFLDYAEYLASLEMVAEVGPFKPVYLDRIAQLTVKTNQFNLTTRRYSRSEIETLASSPHHITRYIRLSDRFGDNGLISVGIGRLESQVLHIDLWLMSCRVLKRDVELLMLDEFVDAAAEAGASRLKGYYFRTAKNGMVRTHYEKLGFTPVNHSSEISEWTLSVQGYEPKNTRIKRVAMPASEES